MNAQSPTGPVTIQDTGINPTTNMLRLPSLSESHSQYMFASNNNFKAPNNRSAFALLTKRSGLLATVSSMFPLACAGYVSNGLTCTRPAADKCGQKRCARGLPVPSVNTHAASPTRRLSPAHFLCRNGHASRGVSKKQHIGTVRKHSVSERNGKVAGNRQTSLTNPQHNSGPQSVIARRYCEIPAGCQWPCRILRNSRPF